MDILGKARRIESKLARTFESKAQQWSQSGPRTPLEVLQAILDAVEERLEPAGRGTHVFPFNRIKVSIVVPTRESRARFAALFDAAPTLQERVRARLRDVAPDAPDPQVKVLYVERAAPTWTMPDMHIEFDRVAAPEVPRDRSPEPETVKIIVVHGTAERPSYALALPRINLGRCSEVRDSRHQLLQTNHVVFTEAETGPNTSVSRRHAHIECAGELRQFRICDDGSAHGTGIVRNGRTINVPTGARGIRLRSGDEILLGEARVRVRFENE